LTAALQPLDRAERDAIARRYGNAGHALHARWKLAYDPVYAAAAGLLFDTSLPLLDIGCGLGLLGHWLHARGQLQGYVGLDHDARKIAAAQAAARRAGLQQHMQLSATDVASLPTVQGNVALLDVLHYLSGPRQQALLASAVEHLAPTGQLIIRSVLREPNWRFHATRVEEFFLRYSGWIPGGAQHYPTADELRRPLEAAGLAVRMQPLRGRTPYNSYLITARREA
jgi:2-polyprenyl-3-methyl-5-hydroxy-6-metoxy-1,4-benzoquinol methylase